MHARLFKGEKCHPSTYKSMFEIFHNSFYFIKKKRGRK